ncbi:hypothetical protein BASA60_002897 [Batrachochytrium salamandrivorans]|nr:hypothetical protein BASA62_003377 [Batrachochytrium salamandrivorans]KAH6580364.1 hypothetical protein BASA60_002897 [Batrachochytrium salamandrivorans]
MLSTALIIGFLLAIEYSVCSGSEVVASVRSSTPPASSKHRIPTSADSRISKRALPPSETRGSMSNEENDVCVPQEKRKSSTLSVLDVLRRASCTTDRQSKPKHGNSEMDLEESPPRFSIESEPLPEDSGLGLKARVGGISSTHFRNGQIREGPRVSDRRSSSYNIKPSDRSSHSLPRQKSPTDYLEEIKLREQQKLNPQRKRPVVPSFVTKATYTPPYIPQYKLSYIPPSKPKLNILNISQKPTTSNVFEESTAHTGAQKKTIRPPFTQVPRVERYKKAADLSKINDHANPQHESGSRVQSHQLAAMSAPVITSVDGRTVLDLKMSMQYIAATYCFSVNREKMWNCGRLCEGATEGTVVHTIIKDPSHSVDHPGIGIIAVQEKISTIVISFRGTMSPREWLINAKYIKVPFFGYRYYHEDPNEPQDILVHYGFMKTYMKVRRQIKEALKPLMHHYKNYRVYFIGHSKGAAFACFMAMEILQEIPPEDIPRLHLYTFGSPRIGNKNWADWVTNAPFAQNVRVAHRNDIVPHMPPNSVGFYHYGRGAIISPDQSVVYCSIGGQEAEIGYCLGYQASIRAHVSGYYHKTGCRLTNLKFRANNIISRSTSWNDPVTIDE